jgi:hypothetical protein
VIVGQQRVGASTLVAPVGTVYAMPFSLAAAARFASAAIYVDTLGTGNGLARLRGVIYDSGRNVVASGDVVTLDDNLPGRWVDLPMPGLQGSALEAGGYFVGAQTGGTSNVMRVYRNLTAAVTAVSASDTFADGLSSPAPAWTTHTWDLAVYAVTFDSFVIPDVTELELSRLPWELSQRAFALSAPIASSSVGAVAGWFGPSFDVEEGAAAIVRSDGALADRVGERLLVTRHVGGRLRQVGVYCYDERTFPDEVADEDLVLTRRAFLELAELWETSLTVEVATLA